MINHNLMNVCSREKILADHVFFISLWYYYWRLPSFFSIMVRWLFVYNTKISIFLQKSVIMIYVLPCFVMIYHKCDNCFILVLGQKKPIKTEELFHVFGTFPYFCNFSMFMELFLVYVTFHTHSVVNILKK